MEKNYVYRLIFDYVCSPDRIELPFVTYKKDRAIFNFEKYLTKEEIIFFVNLAEGLDPSRSNKVKYRAEEKYKNLWVTRISAGDLLNKLVSKYNIEIPPYSYEDISSWEQYFQEKKNDILNLTEEKRNYRIIYDY